MPCPSRLLSIASLIVLTVSLTACGEPAVPQRSAPPAYTLSMQALSDKLAAISLDECATHPAAQVYSVCPRFIAEVEGAANTAAGTVSTQSGAAEIRAGAARLNAAAAAFRGDGCVATPGTAAPSPQACATDLKLIQDELRIVTAAVTASARSGH